MWRSQLLVATHVTHDRANTRHACSCNYAIAGPPHCLYVTCALLHVTHDHGSCYAFHIQPGWTPVTWNWIQQTPHPYSGWRCLVRRWWQPCYTTSMSRMIMRSMRTRPTATPCVLWHHMSRMIMRQGVRRGWRKWTVQVG